ncbi:hypothetical protein LJC63_08305 [Ruminococcaceae bacterium OttesenSCG-928-L11]|nr:hypothetical protein [Ruminococcaceae bacterium OttesenSCG-928-L11]
MKMLIINRVKQIASFLLAVCCFMVITGCAKTDEPEFSDRRPMLMVEDAIYMDTGREVSAKSVEVVILGTITSSVSATETPTENGESNFGNEGAEYAYYDDGLVVNLKDKWIFFEKESGND